MKSRRPIYRPQALQQQSNGDEFAQNVQLVRVNRWIVVGILISLLLVLIFSVAWLHLAGY